MSDSRWWLLPPRDGIRVTVSQLWKQVAAIRQREGNAEGAARARVNASMKSPRAVRPRRGRAGPAAGLRTHWQAWDEGREHPCGTPWPQKLSADPAQVNCGNCKRSKAWPTV